MLRKGCVRWRNRRYDARYDASTATGIAVPMAEGKLI
jgi:hypothetical protein